MNRTQKIISALESQIEEFKSKKNQLVRTQKYEEAANLRDQERKTLDILYNLDPENEVALKDSYIKRRIAKEQMQDQEKEEKKPVYSININGKSIDEIEVTIQDLISYFKQMKIDIDVMTKEMIEKGCTELKLK